MTDLTEKLKKGELKVGFYYVRFRVYGDVIPYLITGRNDAGVISEVLAPVPSYEEYLALKEKADERDNN